MTVGMQMEQPPGKVWQVPKELNMHVPNGPASPLLGMYPREGESDVHGCSQQLYLQKQSSENPTVLHTVSGGLQRGDTRKHVGTVYLCILMWWLQKPVPTHAEPAKSE